MQSAVSRLGLAMGRFALPSPTTGRRPGAAEAFAAVALAADAGVRLIDCPPAPEEAERILGQVLPGEPVFDLVVRAAPLGDPAATVRRLKTSMRRLKRERVAAVLVHAAELLAEDGGALWSALLRLRDEGLAGAIGVAACVCDDPAGLARRFRPDLMQLPLSLLDQRLLANGALDQIASMGVELHLRSIFSHGLLFFDRVEDGAASFAAAHVSRLRRQLAEAGADPMQAALAFALGQPLASKVVVGVGSAGELTAVLRAARTSGPALDWSAMTLDTPCSRDAARCRAA